MAKKNGLIVKADVGRDPGGVAVSVLTPPR